MAKKLSEEEIDEDFIIASMNMTGPSGLNKMRPVQKIEQESEEVKETDKQTNQVSVSEDNLVKDEKESRKRKSRNDYESLFIRQADIAGRQERSIYIREQYYARIDKIIKLYNNSRLSVFAYVDAVLEQHFEMYKKEIKEIHDKLYKAPYDE